MFLIFRLKQNLGVFRPEFICSAPNEGLRSLFSLTCLGEMYNASRSWIWLENNVRKTKCCFTWCEEDVLPSDVLCCCGMHHHKITILLIHMLILYRVLTVLSYFLWEISLAHTLYPLTLSHCQALAFSEKSRKSHRFSFAFLVRHLWKGFLNYYCDLQLAL